MCCSQDIKENKSGGTPHSFNSELIKGMQFFDPHVHMTSRTTDDYQAMADAGIIGLIEPAFW